MKKNQLAILVTSVLAVAGAAYYFYTRQQVAAGEKPPKGAPQLAIQNPGDQSEFATTATESEVG